MAVAKRKPKQAQIEEAEVSPAELLRLYRDMLLIRRFEEKAGQMYGMGLIGGFCHLYIGQEAVVVGIQSCANCAASATRFRILPSISLSVASGVPPSIKRCLA